VGGPTGTQKRKTSRMEESWVREGTGGLGLGFGMCGFCDMELGVRQIAFGKTFGLGAW
jgi:hypothetical protein